MTRRFSLHQMGLVALLGGFCFGISGCEPKGKEPSQTEKQVKGLAIFYGRYTAMNKGRVPPNEAEFKKFIKTMQPTELEVNGADPANLDPYFISPRDNEPFGIAYRTPTAAPSSSGAGTVVWEKTGAGGKRYVADGLGKVEELDEVTFNQRLGAGSRK